jgi:hypothetical protein
MPAAKDHLAEANRHITDAERHIGDQRHRLERCIARGQDSARARELLETMLRALDTMQRHRETILSELAPGKAAIRSSGAGEH